MRAITEIRKSGIRWSQLLIQEEVARPIVDESFIV
jgi:hypothetical protein